MHYIGSVEHDKSKTNQLTMVKKTDQFN